MVTAGWITLAVSVACMAATAAMLMWSYNELSIAGSTPDVSRMSARIQSAMILGFLTTMISAAGFVLLITGLVRRKPVTISRLPVQ